MSEKKKRVNDGKCDLPQIDGLPALLENAKYIGEALEIVGRTLPQFQCIVNSGAQLIGQGLTTIHDIVEIVEFLEVRRGKFPGLFPAPSARAKLAPHPWGNAQHPPTAKHTSLAPASIVLPCVFPAESPSAQRQAELEAALVTPNASRRRVWLRRVAKKGNGKLTLAQKDQIRLGMLMAEKHDNNRTTINRLMSDYGVTEREVRQLARRAHGKFVEDFARRLMRTTPEEDRWRIARWLRTCCPKLEATVSEVDLCKWR